MEYHEIGERFEFDGVVLEVTDDYDYRAPCRDCYFGDKNDGCENLCRNYERKDKKEVIFKFVEKCKTKDMEQENKTEARKNDRLDDKLRWELLPLEDVEDIVRVYTAGRRNTDPTNGRTFPME